MKTFQYLMLTAVIFLSSCGDKFLDRSPISNMNENSFYQTEADFNTAIMSVYQTLHTVYKAESAASFFGELMSDNATMYNHGGNTADYYSFRDHTLKIDNTLVLSFWNDYYKSLFIVNTFINRIEDVDFANRDKLRGEALFIRAMYYFDMVRIWGEVPLVTVPLSIVESYATPRSGEKAVYDQVIADLTQAMSDLPSKDDITEKGRVSSEAAAALLGKVYLTQGEKGKARDMLLPLHGKFSLIPYANLWSTSHKNSLESVFEIQYKGGSGNPYSSYWPQFAPFENNGAVTTKGNGNNQVLDDLWNEYEPGDPRRDISIFNGFYHKDGSYNAIRFPAKWVDTGAPVVGENELCNNNFIILRYADILLMLSEITNDAQYLNEVRARAGLPLFGDPGYPSADYGTLELAIEHERRVELALEFHRLFDLKRTGRASEVLRNSEKAITNAQLLFPVPLDVITQNPDVITQNDIYK